MLSAGSDHLNFLRNQIHDRRMLFAAQGRLVVRLAVPPRAPISNEASDALPEED